MVQAIAHQAHPIYYYPINSVRFISLYFKKSRHKNMDGSQNLMMLAEGKDVVDWDPEGEAFSDIGLSRRQLGREGIIVYTEEFPHHSFPFILPTIINNQVGWGESCKKTLFYIYIEKKSFLDYFGQSIRQCLTPSNKHQDVGPCPHFPFPLVFIFSHQIL